MIRLDGTATGRRYRSVHRKVDVRLDPALAPPSSVPALAAASLSPPPPPPPPPSPQVDGDVLPFMDVCSLLLSELKL